MSTNTMYATRKRRKPIQKRAKPPAEGAKSNPSKRHRERLNGELERLANLLPFSQDVISKLDKLTVLRLSVSYLRAKSFFNVTPKSDSCPKPDGNGQKPGEANFLEGELLLQVLNGFVLVASSDGVVFYVSSTIQEYLGFHQSDIIHQNVYDLIHTEDRPEFRRQLHWALDPTLSPETGQESSDGRSAQLPLACYRPEQLPPENSTFLDRNFVCRVRCLLDNSSGFLAMNFQGRLKFLHAQNQRMKDGLPAPPPLALFAIASPLQPPSILEIRTKSFMFRTKHKLDFTPTACDAKGKTVLGYTEAELCYRGTGYQFIHAADMLHCAENHIRMMKTGESGMTVFRLLTKLSGWVWVQANARLVYKNGKPECIIALQRVITDEEGEEDLSKRNLKLPFGFTTGEAVLYDTNGLLMEGDSSQSNGTRSLDPNSLLGAMLKQDESAYVCVPAQNPVSFQHSALADSGEDQILSGDWQDDILSLSEKSIFKQKPINGSEEDKNGDLLNFMKGLGISREDLELIQKDEEFLQIRLDEQGDIMDVADDILSYVQESLKTSDCVFSNSTERKLSGQDSSCAPQSQQPHLVPHLQHEQPLLQPQQEKPVLQQHLHTQMHPQQPFPQQYLHTQAHPHQPIPQQHPHAQTEQLISQQHPQTQQLISQQNPHAQTGQLISQQNPHAQTGQLISQQHSQTQQLISQQHPQTQQLISQQHPQTQQLFSQQHPQTQQLISQQHPQTQQLISQQHPQTQQLISQQHPQTQQLISQQHPQTQQLISQQHPQTQQIISQHPQTQQLISQQHPQTQQLISQQHPQTQQIISQQHPQTQQLISQQHPQTQQLISQQHPQTQQLISQQHPQTQQLISQQHPQTQQLISQQHPQTQQIISQQYTQTHQLISQQHPQTQQLISQQHPQTQKLISQLHPQTQQLISQQHPQTQKLISQLHPQTQQLISQQHPQTQQIISQQHTHPQTQQVISQQHTHPQTQQLILPQHPRTQEIIPQKHSHGETQQLVLQQHLHIHGYTHQPIPQQNLHMQTPPWQPIPQQHTLVQQQIPQQQIMQQHPPTQTYKQKTAPQQHLQAQMHSQHQSLGQEQPLVLQNQLQEQLQQHLDLQQQSSHDLAQPQLSHKHQELPLKQLPQQQEHLLRSSLPEQQQQLCHKMKHMQVNGKCPSLKQPVAVPTTNGHPLPPPFCADWSLPQYGCLVQEASTLDPPYQKQLNAMSIACDQASSPYTEGLAAGGAGSFTPQNLEDLLEGLQPGATGERHCATILQDGNTTPLCHPTALPVNQGLPETCGLGREQQANPKLVTPCALGHQPFLSHFQNGSGGVVTQTQPESIGGMGLPQPGRPLHRHPDESRPFQDLTMGGVM